MSIFPADSHQGLKTIAYYLLSILVSVLWTMVLIQFRENINPHTIAMLYLIPVLTNTALWGLGPGVTTASLAFLAFNYYFLPPYHSFTVHQWQDIFILLVFLIISFVISNLIGRSKKSLAKAVQREQELRILYDHSMALSRVFTLESIAQVITDHSQQTFHAEYVELFLQPEIAQSKVLVSTPSDSPPPVNKPDKIVALLSNQQLWGEIRLWRALQEFIPSEERLLQTLAAQAALALERSALREAQNRAEILEKSDQLKSALLNSVSHELRTPLASIKAAVSGLLNQEINWKPTDQQELLSVIDEETDHLNRLVGNLLDMSRLEAGALKPERKWNDLNEIIQQALKDSRRILKDFKIKLDLPEDLPLFLVDYLQFEHVFVNLLSNSAKYSPPGTEIGIKANFHLQEGLHLYVTNKGPQVPEGELKQIFDKFHRLANFNRVSGTGLGLSICKGIIEAHNGQISAENRTNGLAFHIWLPPQYATNPEMITLPDQDNSERES
jgi:two-component system sensor histidine kinase KdpD